jgi:hypothetical protein
MTGRDKRRARPPTARWTNQRRTRPILTVADAQQHRPQVGFAAGLAQPTEGRQGPQFRIGKALIATVRAQCPSRIHRQVVKAPVAVLIRRQERGVAVVAQRCPIRGLATENPRWRAAVLTIVDPLEVLARQLTQTEGLLN